MKYWERDRGDTQDGVKDDMNSFGLHQQDTHIHNKWSKKIKVIQLTHI